MCVRERERRVRRVSEGKREKGEREKGERRERRERELDQSAEIAIRVCARAQGGGSEMRRWERRSDGRLGRSCAESS